MTGEVSLRRSPLVAGAGLPAGTPATVLLRDVGWTTLVDLRLATAQDGSGADTAAVESALGLRLPAAGRLSSDGERLAVWLGPGWWLLDWPDELDRRGVDPGGVDPGGVDPGGVDPGKAEQALDPPLVRRLRAAGGRLSAVEVSAGFAVLEVTGPHAPAVLAHGCSIDLHPRVFGPGRAARTMLAKAQVVLAHTDDAARGEAPTYRIWVRSSFARYLVAWLLDAATEYLA